MHLIGLECEDEEGPSCRFGCNDPFIVVFRCLRDLDDVRVGRKHPTPVAPVIDLSCPARLFQVAQDVRAAKKQPDDWLNDGDGEG